MALSGVLSQTNQGHISTTMEPCALNHHTFFGPYTDQGYRTDTMGLFQRP